MESLSSCRLSEIVQVIPGAALVSDGAETVPVVQAREVGGLLPALDALRRSGVAPGKRRESAQLRAGDILVVAKGPAPRVSLVGQETEGAVASANLIVLRVKPGQIVPAALHAYLQTPSGQQNLIAAQTGSAMPSLSTAALGKVRVPALPVDVQARIGEFACVAAELLASSERALTLQRELVARITETAFAGGDLSPFSKLEFA